MLLRARGLRSPVTAIHCPDNVVCQYLPGATFHPGSSTFTKHLGFLRLVGLSSVLRLPPDRPAPSRAPVSCRALFQIFGAETLPHTRTACYP